MTRDEETNERNACDEWFHEQPNKGASIQDAWVERARRAKAHPIYQYRPTYKDSWHDCSKDAHDHMAKYPACFDTRIVYADQSGYKEA